MENTLKNIEFRILIKSTGFDLFAIAAIYLIPTLSHLFTLPIYFIEPMRLMLILAIVHTSKKNAYFLAATLPLFSFIVSAHPVILKTLLISGELFINVWLFYFVAETLTNKFGAALLSIAISKVVYYVIKIILLSFLLLEGNLFSTPILIQFSTMVIFSGYIFLMRDRLE